MDEHKCCSNFENVMEFSKGIVTSLGELSVDNFFSIVQFSTNAQVVSELADPDQTLKVIDSIKYSGGTTNQGDALRLCQQTLASASQQGRQNFIVIITDGEPTMPELAPKFEAETAAMEAKDAGTFIIPVLISANYSQSLLNFTRTISSDGNVFVVSDFVSLYDLREELLSKVSCQSR